jgi:hypothetical protein
LRLDIERADELFSSREQRAHRRREIGTDDMGLGLVKSISRVRLRLSIGKSRI